MAKENKDKLLCHQCRKYRDFVKKINRGGIGSIHLCPPCLREYREAKDKADTKGVNTDKMSWAIMMSSDG